MISFRRVTRDDFGLLARWLAEPHVHRWWWHEFTPEAVERDFGPWVDGLEPGEDHLALLDGRPVGLVQMVRFDDDPESVEEMRAVYPVPAGAYEVDYLIGEPDLVGRGLGTAVITAFVERLWATQPDATCIVVPVASANGASWRMLLKCGFDVVARGVLPPDNPIDDGWHEVLRLDRPGSAQQ